ncbi:fumarylacetoacetate hydrolase family protein [Blastococcus sp. TF02A-26]|uniref:fumarylacetoacetate hydrolase family protein n=1 Tax=Blastococcus sp. TF02A-26 TaxID=2250577 RepID=UPI000DE9DB04|nr:fumarylacetoacetate hydrolase family protein [Blastococcus sp. TF02A-26]RBY90819.1 2-hydroxyhepta-2,4-diene-1,7-dioate isomerase [Blastococcus sp. TF02A-26]
MRLATVRTAEGTRAVRVDADRAVETGHADVGELLAVEGWRAVAEAADGPAHDPAGLNYAPVVPRPGKVVCVGINYGAHIAEMGRETPEHPTLFAKYAEALIGANDDVVLPAASQAVDWEAELAVVIGSTVRHADEAAATAAIAGYSVLNDVTARDWQYRTLQWLQGKTFEATTPFGPHLVTPDEAGEGLDLSCAVDGEVVQTANTADLVFGAAATIAYVSTILTLRPGDVLALGTPGGVGHARKPPRYLAPGQVLTTAIAGLGECRNTCVAER